MPSDVTDFFARQFADIGQLPTADRPGWYRDPETGRERSTILKACSCGGDNCPGYYVFFWDGRGIYEPRYFDPENAEFCFVQSVAVASRETGRTISQTLARFMIARLRADQEQLVVLLGIMGARRPDSWSREYGLLLF